MIRIFDAVHRYHAVRFQLTEKGLTHQNGSVLMEIYTALKVPGLPSFVQ